MLRPYDLTFYTYLTRPAAMSLWQGLPLVPGHEGPPSGWTWAPIVWPTIEGTLDTINALTAAGWERIPGVYLQKTSLQLFHLFGQLGHLVAVQMPGHDGNDPELWARSEDLRRTTERPVMLAFALDTLPDGAVPTQHENGAITLKMAGVLPPPQLGNVGLVYVDQIPGENMGGWKTYRIEALGEDAQNLQQRLADALRELAGPADWWPQTDALQLCYQPGYQQTKQELHSRLLSTRGKERERIRVALAPLEEANAHYKALQIARNWYSPETWVERWEGIRQMAQELAAAYWAAHTAPERQLEALPKRKLPQIPGIWSAENDLAQIPSMMPVQAPLLAYSHGQSGKGWLSDDEGYPTFTHTTDNHSTSMQVRAEHDSTVPNEATIQSLWQQVREYSDLDGDVFLAMLAQTMIAAPDDEGCVWITGGAILDYRGIAPIVKREGNDATRRAGHRTEDLIEIARCIGRQTSQWVVIRSMLEDSDAKGKSKARRRRMWTHESRLTQVAEVIRQHELDIEPAEEGAPRVPSYPIAWRFKMGTWIKPFLEGPNRKVAYLCQQALKYDPMREQWEKRLARYLVFHLRINAAGGGASIKRNVGKLIDELALPVDERHPERTRQRFERALERLQTDGQIDTWEYDSENATLPARKWLETWRGWNVRIGAAPLTSAKYAQITARAQARRERAATLHDLETEREKRTKAGTDASHS